MAYNLDEEEPCWNAEEICSCTPDDLFYCRHKGFQIREEVYLMDDDCEDSFHSSSFFRKGNLTLTGNVCTWSIKKIFLNWAPNKAIRSPEFYYEDVTWELKVFPCGRVNKRQTDTNGWFEIALCPQGPPDMLNNKLLSVRFELTGLCRGTVTSDTVRDRKWFVTHRLIESDELMNSEIKNVTIVCHIQNDKKTSRNERPVTQSYPAGLLQVTPFLSERSHIDCSLPSTSYGGNINGPSTSQSFTRTNGNSFGSTTSIETQIGGENKSEAREVKMQSTLPKGVAKVLEDYKKLLSEKMHSDITIKVQNKEFKAHRSILAARTPVFDAMLEHTMREKVTGVVAISDMDPETFPDFLEYLYTGQVQNLSSANVLELFTVADKYQVKELREECYVFMKENLSVENFCSIMSLSIQHHEKELTAAATQFFIKNAMDIVKTPDWRFFMGENVDAANDLFIKQLEFSNQILSSPVYTTFQNVFKNYNFDS